MSVRILNAVRRAAIAATGLAVVAWGAGTISACSLLHSGDDDAYDYRKTKVRQQPLDVPPDLSQLPKDDRFQVPAGAANSARAAETPAAAPVMPAAGAPAVTGVTPAGLIVAPVSASAHIVRLGNQRWLAVDVSPEVAYVTVRDLWVSMGLKIKVDEPLVGLLETDWSEVRPDVDQDIVRDTLHRVLGAFKSNSERNKYRARIERTANNTAEITISHRGLEEVFDSPARDSTTWQARQPDPELEALMLQRLALRFAPAQPLRVAVAPEASAGAPVVAAAAPAAVPVTLIPVTKVHKVTTGGIATLQVEESLERTWRKLGIALDHLGFTIEARSREKNQYSVRYLDPEYEASEREKRGWWDRLFNSDAKIPEQQFLIVASANGATTVVEVQDKDGHADSGATAKHILDQLDEQLR